MGWDGMGCDGMGCDVMRWDVVRCLDEFFLISIGQERRICILILPIGDKRIKA